jgi:UDP-N-acetylglucosamine 2-epimerase (non-hydrolysing)
MKYKIISVVGARPNFIKIAPIDRELKNYSDIQHKICHTGQHFDETMSSVFFEQLGISQPDYNLGISGGTHAKQVAAIMTSIEDVLLQENPDMIVVPGDVNSTLAAALTAAKIGIPIAHVESGLRSFDRSMPEEINRVLTDHLSDLLFVTEKSGVDNLLQEGIDSNKIFFAGNVMIDSLANHINKLSVNQMQNSLGVVKGNYIVGTFHRPSNVDQYDKLKELVLFLNWLSTKSNLILPLHPRTQNSLKRFNLDKLFNDEIILTDPMSYFDFVSLISEAKLVVTDSGGIQEETTYLRVPCITVRNNTERPVTCELGTNILAGTSFQHVRGVVEKVINTQCSSGKIPELWDGKAGERICKILHDHLNMRRQ